MEKISRPKHYLSRDGSSTLYSEQYGQFYHNPNGAISESVQVYFEASKLIKKLIANKEPISIFEIGFGTGLNFLLLLEYYLDNQLTVPVRLYSVEAFPVSEETAETFNFSSFLKDERLKDVLPSIFRELRPGKNVFFPIAGKDIQLHLFYSLFEELHDEIDSEIDFIFHDAFSPDVNEELWSVQTFQKLASFCKPEAVLTTYCASSKARASMAKAGWFLAKAKGALGKREMTIASLSENSLSDFKRVNEHRLIERWDRGEFDEHKKPRQNSY